MGGIEAPAPFLHASQHAPGGTDPVLGIVAADVDSAIQVWDDPFGIGYAAPCFPWASSNQSAMTANRASFARAVSGGVVNFIRLNVFTQSGNIDIGIYANTGIGTAARPGARLWSTGSTPCPPQGLAVFSVVPGITVKARQHWFGFSVDNAVASFYQMTVPNQLFEQFAGWGAYRDTGFPLPNPAGSLNNGYFRIPTMAGRST